jgi:hypothetical protein
VEIGKLFTRFFCQKYLLDQRKHTCSSTKISMGQTRGRKFFNVETISKQEHQRFLLFVRRQSDQTGGIFAHWKIVYLGHTLEITEAAHFWGLLCYTAKKSIDFAGKLA